MVHFLAVSGFLGAGKTTTLVALARHLEAQGRTVALVTNDQAGDLVDSQVAGTSGALVDEVTGGCFCCRFDDLLGVVSGLVEQGHVDTVIAEAVGSCTDLQATVVRPLLSLHGDTFEVGPLVTVVSAERVRAVAADPDSDMAYLFGKQLEEADVIALNKADLTEPGTLDRVEGDLRDAHPDATVLRYSALTGTGLGELADAALQRATGTTAIAVDYDRYARAEAELAWLNLTLAVGAPATVRPQEWTRVALEHLSASAQARAWVIGHAKIAFVADGGLTKMSLTEAGSAPTVDMVDDTASTEAVVRFNARVACEPEELDAAVAAAARAADDHTAATSSPVAPANSFKPGYPTPVHHLPAFPVAS